MFGLNNPAAVGTFVGGFLEIYLFSLLFHYAMFGKSSTRTSRTWVVLMTGAVAIGFFAFNQGTGGFVSQITNAPPMINVVSYSLAAMIIAFFVWLREDEVLPDKTGRGSIAGRTLALIIAVPMILIGLGNIGGNVYRLVADNSPSVSGPVVSGAELREIMMAGDLAPFWQMLAERAPAELDMIVDRLSAHEELLRSEDDARRIMDAELDTFRDWLALSAPKLSDTQRKEIIAGLMDMLRKVEDRPEVCVDLAVTGGRNLDQDQLLVIKDQINRYLMIMTGHLLDAKNAKGNVSTSPGSPTDSDYEALVADMISAGVTVNQMLLLFEQNPSEQNLTNPETCPALIKFMSAIATLDGPAGESIRFETVQELLSGSP